MTNDDALCVWYTRVFAHAVWLLQLSCLFLWNLIYHAFYNIQRELHSPYGQRRIDLAHESQVAAIRRLAVNLMDHAENRLPAELHAATQRRQATKGKGKGAQAGKCNRKGADDDEEGDDMDEAARNDNDDGSMVQDADGADGAF